MNFDSLRRPPKMQCTKIANVPARIGGSAVQADAQSQTVSTEKFISTDPPYYDNISYADLSDFFYVWQRRSLGEVYTDLFSTMLVPKVQELIAAPYRFGGDGEKAKEFFESGLSKAFTRMREAQHLGYPLTVFYAFKQAEMEEDDHEQSNGVPVVISTGSIPSPKSPDLKGLLS